MTGGREELMQTFRFQQFSGSMLIFVLLHIVLILLDRYLYISNENISMINTKIDSAHKPRGSILGKHESREQVSLKYQFFMNK